MDDRTGIVIACIVIAIFTALRIIGMLKAVNRYFNLKNHGERVEAKVTEIDKAPLTLLSRGGDAPIFEFETKDKEIIRGVPLNCVYSNPSFYEPGDMHTLFYDPYDPSLFIIKKPTELILLFLGILMFLGFFAVSVWGVFMQG